MATYPAMLFTDISPGELDTSTILRSKYDLGWLLVGAVLLNIGVNMLIMVGINLFMLWKAIKKLNQKYNCLRCVK
jgi:hypothetical protein